MNKEIKNGSDQEVIKKESAKKKSLTKKEISYQERFRDSC